MAGITPAILHVSMTDGFFAMAGRKKTVIVTGGINVHPENITTTIRNLEGVIDAVTFGLKNEVFGEIVVSCVVVAPDSGLDANAFMTHCRISLSAEKVPAAVYLLDDLPRGPAGKVLLDDVKVLAAERAHGKINSTGDILEQVLEIAARTFKVPLSTLTLQSTPDNTNGWDSLRTYKFHRRPRAPVQPPHNSVRDHEPALPCRCRVDRSAYACGNHRNAPRQLRTLGLPISDE